MSGGKSGEGKTDPNSIDSNSPYYIHASDSPRQMQVNDPLTDNNYSDWVQEMSNFLFAKNKMDFVDGTIPKPAKDAATYMMWMRCDAMIKGWLTTAMNKDIRGSVKYANTASEIWADLKERFGKESAPRAYELKQMLTVTRQDGTSVSAYYTKLRGLWDEIHSVLPIPRCTCGTCSCDVGKRMSQFQEKERLYEFLMGLDNDFSAIRTHILSMKINPTLGEAYRLASEDEQQRTISATNRPRVEAAAFQATTTQPRKDPATTQLRYKGAQKEQKRNTGGEIDHCTFCGRDGHKREGCFKLIGYPEWWPGKTKQEKPKPKAACVNAEQDTEKATIAGLTEEQYQTLLKHFSSTKVATEGDKIPKANMAGKFTHDDDWGLNSRKLIGTGRCVKGLYRMGMVAKERKAMMTKVDATVWHKRLGHASSMKLCQIESLNDVSFDFQDNVCDACIKAKHTRSLFQKSSIKTNECFDLIHCDVWGKYRKPTTTHANFFLTIVDDFSRAVWVYLIKHKSEAGDCLMAFHKMVKTQFGKDIKRIRSDNGGEFVSNRMTNFYTEEGILLETTCPHTPQQNGVVERKHRHLLEMARALMFQASLPKRFWGECIQTACYIINRLPSKVIGNKTPYEIVFRKKPDYDRLRVMGCLAYYRSIETNGDKFEFRGRPGVFLGYPQGTKGYKIFDVEHGKIAVSRDVTFVEKVFPFEKLKTNNSNQDLFNVPEEDYEIIFEEPYNSQKATQMDPHGPNIGTEEAPGSGSMADATSPQREGLPIGLDNTRGQPQDFLSPSANDGLDQTPAPTHSLGDDAHETGERVVNEFLSTTRGKRTISQPSYLKEFHVNLPPSVDHTQPVTDQSSSTVHSLANYVSYEKFSNSHKVFLTAITTHNEPKSFHEAMQDENWKLAMKKEIQALEENKTWTLEPLPEGKRAIDSKWVYKLKYKPNGEIERHKARLVAKGYTQMEGVDFHDTFAPVAKLVTVRTLLAVAVKKEWLIHQLDVNNAFLHGDLDEEVYMKIPQGFAKRGETRVCRLRKSLYGLKQASRNWYHKFTSSLVDIGYKQSHADHSLFTFKDGVNFVAILIYVDDVVITGNDATKIQETKQYLDNKFSIKNLGPLKYFLGIEVARTVDGLVLSQRKYTLDLLEDTGMLGCRPSPFPMEQGLKLDNCQESPKVDAQQYRRLIGRLLYLQATRPDIAYSVNLLSQFVSDPREDHLFAAHRILRYLKSSPGQGVFLPKHGGLHLSAFCDADWLGCQLTRRSRTGYLLLLGGAPISWKTKKQSVVSRSSAEAEYRSMASTVSEVIWMRWLLTDLQVVQDQATPIFCDNLAVKHIANNPVFHERTKHVEMDCYFIRERVESKDIFPLHIDTKQQIADLFTKPLGAQHLQILLHKLGVRDLHAPT
ncbi:putative RNA-directed DNA polymerase [Helianthus annuus]|uniref:RNA-directed DNA polymerase n=1 Tax=Helianthus annuus TaxID=4232 RepID=A0A9K3ENP4_HELAN|nr:putative RNA-directed DNA polymerase [Helianthus annuus]